MTIKLYNLHKINSKLNSKKRIDDELINNLQAEKDLLKADEKGYVNSIKNLEEALENRQKTISSSRYIIDSLVKKPRSKQSQIIRASWVKGNGILSIASEASNSESSRKSKR